ncbi:MAG: C40 family peptidase [Coriobacteriales bacterium]|nr:C40 family peptidase [Coriobacteriales bacterium]
MKEISRRKFVGATVAGAAAAVLCAAGNPWLALATPTSAEKKAEAEAVERRLDSYRQQLDEASDAYYEALEEHDAAVERMNEAQARIEAAEAKIAKYQDHLATRAEAMYRNGSLSFLEVLLGSSSFDEFVTTWDFLKELNQSDVDIVAETKIARAEAQAAYEEYTKQEAIAAEALERAEETKKEAEALVRQYQRELDALNEEIARLVEEERRAREAAAAAAAAASSGSGGGGGGYAPSSSLPSNPTVVDYAKSRLGCPYVWGATGPNTFDCSGLTWWCYRQVGKSIPRTSGAQKSGAKAVIAISGASPGDVLWTSGHVGMYVGGSQCIHAPQPGDVVRYAGIGQFSCALRF